MAKKKKPSFFAGLGRSIVQNLPLLLGGVLLFVVGLITDVLILRILSISMFIAYFLSCSVQSVYSVTSKSIERAGEDPPKDAVVKKDRNDQEETKQ